MFLSGVNKISVLLFKKHLFMCKKLSAVAVSQKTTPFTSKEANGV